jgi:hypothetical protein
LFPVVDLRASRVLGYGNLNSAVAENMRTGFIRLAATECVAILECALEVVALALTILLVARLARYGVDTFSDALGRLRKVPAAASILLKLFVIVLVIAVGTSLIAMVPVLLYVPWHISMHSGMHPPLKWVSMLSIDAGRLLFVLCIMPFLLDFVAHFLQRPSLEEDRPKGLLGQALSYGVIAVAVEIGLGLLLRPLQMHLGASHTGGSAICQTLMGLAVNLITSLPTIVCVVAVAMMMSAEEPVTETEPA